MPARPTKTPLPRGIGRAATGALAVERVTTLEQVARWTEAELLALHGVGPKAVAVLRAELAAGGLSFASPSPSKRKR